MTSRDGVPIWKTVFVFGAIWLGLGLVGWHLAAIGLGEGPNSLAATVGVSGGITLAIAATHRIERKGWKALVASLGVLASAGYVAFGLVISGVAFLLVGASAAFDAESGLMLYLLTFFGPALGLPALLGLSFLVPRPRLVALLRARGTHAQLMVNVLLTSALVLSVWGVAWGRYAREKSQLDETSEQTWSDLERRAVRFVRLYSEILQQAPPALQSSVAQPGPVPLEQKLERCVLAASAVSECGVLAADGDFRALRRSSLKHCGNCAWTNCSASARGPLQLIATQIPEADPLLMAAQDQVRWAAPRLSGGECDEVSLVTPVGQEHLVVTLSLASLANELRQIAPSYEAFVSDDRGQISTGSGNNHAGLPGGSVYYCLAIAACKDARDAAKTIMRQGKRRYSMLSGQHSRRLGYAAEIVVPDGLPDPHWLLTLSETTRDNLVE